MKDHRQKVLKLFGGKSGLQRAVHRVTPFRRKTRNSGTERMSKAMSLRSGTGDLRGAVGVKTAKLCTKQDQIGKRFNLSESLQKDNLGYQVWFAPCFRVDCLRLKVTLVLEE